MKKLAEPQTEAQRFGDRFAKAIEARLKGEQIPRFDAVADATIARFLSAADTFFPEGSNPDIYAERKIEFDVPDLPARMIGYIDVLDLSGGSVHIRDHKTRSDKRYALSHAKLLTDVQLNIYAYAIRLDLPEARFADATLSHINYVKPPKKLANDIEYLTNTWEPEVFSRQVPLDTAQNDAIIDGVKSVIEEMVRYSDPLLTPEQVPMDETGEACFSYGQPCTYSAICPKFNFTLKPASATMALKTLPPPPPSRNTNPSAPPAPPGPIAQWSEQAAYNRPVPGSIPGGPTTNEPSRLPPPPPGASKSVPPAPPSVNKSVPPAPPAPPAMSKSVPPPPPAMSKSVPPPPPAPIDTSKQQTAGDINPPSHGSLFVSGVEVEAADSAERSTTPPMSLAAIPNVSQKAKAWLESQGVTSSVQIAHLTEAYLMGFKLTKTLMADLLKVSRVMRGLHRIEEPDPFANLPPISDAERSASSAEMLADLPDHEPAVVEEERPAPPAPPARAAAPSPAPAPVVEKAPFYLYLECAPVKGATFVTLEEFLTPVFREIEKAAGVRSWRSITEFGRFSEMVHLCIRDIIEGRAEGVSLPEHLVVLSIYTEYAKAALDLLMARATLVVSK